MEKIADKARLLPAGFFFISTHHRATPWLILQNRGMSYEHLILYLTITIPGLIASPFVGMFLGNIIYEWFERVRARFSSYGEDETVIPDSEIINERTEGPLKIGTIFPSRQYGRRPRGTLQTMKIKAVRKKGRRLLTGFYGKEMQAERNGMCLPMKKVRFLI